MPVSYFLSLSKRRQDFQDNTILVKSHDDLAISVRRYARLTRDLLQEAGRRGAHRILITDSSVGILSRDADTLIALLQGTMIPL